MDVIVVIAQPLSCNVTRAHYPSASAQKLVIWLHCQLVFLNFNLILYEDTIFLVEHYATKFNVPGFIIPNTEGFQDIWWLVNAVLTVLSENYKTIRYTASY